MLYFLPFTANLRRMRTEKIISIYVPIIDQRNTPLLINNICHKLHLSIKVIEDLELIFKVSIKKNFIKKIFQR